MSAEISRHDDSAAACGKLQWGRARMSAEIATRKCSRKGRIGASMGPRSDERGNKFIFALFNGTSKLQWGRARMSAEIIPVSSCPGCLSDAASMGPRSDERGNLMGSGRMILSYDKLQWGRARMSAEIRRPTDHSALQQPCFNGAALG